MSAQFTIDFFSSSQYEYLTVEISYGGQLLCQLNRDKGIDAVEIEFFADMRVLDNSVAMKFAFDEFIKVVQEGKKLLLE